MTLKEAGLPNTNTRVPYRELQVREGNDLEHKTSNTAFLDAIYLEKSETLHSSVCASHQDFPSHTFRGQQREHARISTSFPILNDCRFCRAWLSRRNHRYHLTLRHSSNTHNWLDTCSLRVHNEGMPPLFSIHNHGRFSKAQLSMRSHRYLMTFETFQQYTHFTGYPVHCDVHVRIWRYGCCSRR